ncbi:MAG: hypothetical protein LBP93_00420, partial [Treponema sp.]|nr:hypothetical protein [Treponema sp.]
MKNFIGEQHIRRRKVPSLLFRTGAYRPAVYKPIDQIKQRPAHIRRRHKNSGIALFRRLWRCLFGAGKAAPGTKEAPRQEAPRQEAPRPEAPRRPEKS